MKEHLSDSLIEGYASRSLDNLQLLSVDDHLQSCSKCRERAADAIHLSQRLRVFSEQLFDHDLRHPAADDLHSYVDAKLSSEEKEVLESHLSDCSECSIEVSELRKIQSALPIGAPSRKPNWIGTLAIAASIVLFILAAAFYFRKEEVPVIVESGKKPTSPIRVALQDKNGMIKIHTDGKISGIETFPSKYGELVATVLKTESVPLPKSVRALKGEAEILMGGETNGYPFAVITPVGTIILSATPEFRWNELQEASTYTVQVFDEKFNLVAESPALKNTSWRMSDSLARGKHYVWQVVADQKGEKITSPQTPAPPAKFRVLDEVAFRQIQQLQNLKPESHLLLGLAYAESGLVLEAEKQFQELVRLNPDSALAAKLLESLRQEGSPTRTNPAQ
jgi:hypothetical protein